MGPRILLSLAATLVALLLGEGVLSLCFGTSIRQLLDRSDVIAPAAPREQQDEERFAAAASNPGPYRVHEDPRVGYVLKSESEVVVEKITVRSDHLGLRRRADSAVPETEEALRVLVLGDSVAFGWNLQDEETFAHQLESALSVARGPGATPVVTRTVAVPGWNTRNAACFVLDHLDELRPDHVIFLPVDNDLEDTDGVYETGHRRNAGDVCNADPLLNVNQNQRYLSFLALRLQQEGKTLSIAETGPSALLSATSTESTRRIDDMVAVLLDLRDRLATRGASLHLAAHYRNEVQRLLLGRLAERGETLPAIPLLAERRPEDTQVDDAHPNAEVVRVLAIWAADSLLANGVIDRGAGAPLPELPAAFEERRAAPLGSAEAKRWIETMRTQARDALWPEVNDLTGRGVRQIYGGIRLGGRMGPRLLALLAPAGARLEVRLRPLEARPDLYPIDIEVEADGAPLGRFTLRGDAQEHTQVFTLPSSPKAPVEVRLKASHWTMMKIAGKSYTMSCEFVSLTLSD